VSATVVVVCWRWYLDGKANDMAGAYFRGLSALWSMACVPPSLSHMLSFSLRSTHAATTGACGRRTGCGEWTRAHHEHLRSCAGRPPTFLLHNPIRELLCSALTTHCSSLPFSRAPFALFLPPLSLPVSPPLKVLASPRVLPPALLARRRRRRLVYRPRPVWCPRLVWWPQFSRWRRLPRWRQVRWRQTQRGGLRQRPERAHDHGDRAGRGVSWRPHRPRAICRRAGLGGSCGCGGGCCCCCCCCCCGGGAAAGSSRSSRSPHGRDGG